MEKMKDFYVRYFDMECGELYANSRKKFNSYFLSFKEASTRIEFMFRPDIVKANERNASSFGLTHLAISVGGKRKVDSLTEELRKNGYTITGEPRTTGDGYYESVIEDPEGNWIEIT